MKDFADESDMEDAKNTWLQETDMKRHEIKMKEERCEIKLEKN